MQPETNWLATLLGGGVPALVASIVTIKMALHAVNNEREGRRDERRINVATSLVEALQNGAPALNSFDPRESMEALGPAFLYSGRVVGMYAREVRYRKFTNWLESEVRGLMKELHDRRFNERLTHDEVADFIATTSVMISSTIDFMMLGDPKTWTPSTQAREDLAAERAKKAATKKTSK